MVGLVSAAGLVGLLSEPDTELQVFALRSANEGIGLMWTEFAGSVDQMYVHYSFDLLYWSAFSRWSFDLPFLYVVRHYMKMNPSRSVSLPRSLPLKSTTTYKSTMKVWPLRCALANCSISMQETSSKIP